MNAFSGNYHTHSTYCDGKNTLRQLADTAVEKGMTYLGFSSHCMHPFSSEWHIPVRSIQAYCDEIAALKAEYAGKLTILKGFEAEFIPGIAAPDFSRYETQNPDYLIGAVHFVTNPADTGPVPRLCAVDDKAAEVAADIEKEFHGDAKAFVQEYFAWERAMIESCHFTFLAHADLIRRRNKELHFFDETDGWYRREIKETARTIARHGVVVEINTGGQARGCTDSPYPSLEFLSLLNKYDVPALVNADAHEKENLTWGFDIAMDHAKTAGYGELQLLTENGFVTYTI